MGTPIPQLVKKQKKFYSTHATKDADFRINQLKKLKSAITAYEEKIVEALYMDLHKSRAYAYLSEIGFCLDELTYAIRNIRSWMKPQNVGGIPYLPFTEGMIYPEPYGVVLIISPWNYPFQLAISPLIGAIAAGNCAIIKPSTTSTNTEKVLKQMMDEYFPEEYIKVVTGDRKVSEQLLAQKLDHIFFTGGVATGRQVMAAAAKNLTPITMELGGKSPCIVDQDINIEISAQRIVWGKFMNSGQMCVSPDYLLVHKKIKQKLVGALKMKIVDLYGSDPKKSRDYARIINKRHFDRIKGYLKEGRIVFGGETDAKELYISPTLIENVPETGKLMEEEIFGPILPIIEYENIDGAIEFINNKPKPLALYIFSNNKKIQQKVLNETSSGGVCVNDTVIHVIPKHLPFGGVGESGFGRYHGKASFETFSNKKSVLKQTTLGDPRVRYPPHSDLLLKLAKKIFR